MNYCYLYNYRASALNILDSAIRIHFQLDSSFLRTLKQVSFGFRVSRSDKRFSAFRENHRECSWPDTGFNWDLLLSRISFQRLWMAEYVTVTDILHLCCPMYKIFSSNVPIHLRAPLRAKFQLCSNDSAAIRYASDSAVSVHRTSEFGVSFSYAATHCLRTRYLRTIFIPLFNL